MSEALILVLKLGAAVIGLAFWAPVALVLGQGVVETDAEVRLLADGFSFTEGPAVDSRGVVYFTDQPNDRIMRWTLEGQLELFLSPSGRSNGLYFNRTGKLIACADEENQLWEIDTRSGEVTVLVRDFQGRLLNGPNDLWVAPDSSIYFTDPLYKRPYWKRSPETQLEREAVYYLTADRKTLRVVNDELAKPNGIVGTPDGKTLYVADIRDDKTYAFEILADGRLSNRRLFCSQGSDGMTLDREGNLYLTGRGVTVYNSEGRQIEQIPVDQPWTANVCFGGEDLRTLFITASRAVYGVRMRVAGVR